MNDHSMQNGAIEELLKSVNFMIQSALKNTTKIYNGFVVSNNNDGRWNIQYNGEIHPIQAYGAAVPTVGMIVKVIVPQGNQALSWFFVPIESSGSSGGTTFIPSVSQDGVISWTNDGDLPNPTPVNIKGPQGNAGEQGIQGEVGPQGATGPYFTPSVSDDGDLSWTNNGGLQNPNTVNIMGPQGEQGIQGPKGEKGETGTQGPQGIQGETGPYFIPSVDTEGNLSWSNTGNLQNPQTVNIKGPQGAQGIQGEQGEIGPQGEKGNTGPYYTPSISSDGDLSWTNNGGLVNPPTVNIQGPKGDTGEIGPTGIQGDVGPYFTPSVDSNGNLSWANNGSLPNPATVNIRGPQGNTGPTGANGADATINGINTLTLVATGGLTGTQSGNTYSISGENLPYLKTTGGTLTGNLTGQYLTGTWLQSTAVYELTSSNFKGVCVFDDSGWVYYRTKEHFLADIGAATQDYVDSAVTNAGGVKKFSGTLEPNSWTTSSGNYPYQAKISISDMTAESVPSAYPQWTNPSVESIEWNKLSGIESFNGYVQFYATSPFSVSIDYIIEY